MTQTHISYLVINIARNIANVHTTFVHDRQYGIKFLSYVTSSVLFIEIINNHNKLSHSNKKCDESLSTKIAFFKYLIVMAIYTGYFLVLMLSNTDTTLMVAIYLSSWEKSWACFLNEPVLCI